MERLIFHIDVNSAYLSWEAAKRVSKGEEDIRLIPAIIGGDRDKRTGVVLAKSIPAKQCGIKTGEPVGMALRKCPDLFLAKPDFGLYEKSSKSFMNICRQYTPILEKFSIDECFLDMTGSCNIYPDPINTAYDIKDTIYSKLGFTVNVGISTNKLLAKMASDFEKPNKVHTLFPEEIKHKMWPLPVGELFSVGYHSVEKLNRIGIHTIGDLAISNITHIQLILGTKFGQQIWNYANGIDPSPVLSEPEKAKGYSVSTTLEKDISSFSEANKVLLSLSESVAARIRADQARSSCIGVTIRGNDFKNHSHQKKLLESTDITKEVYEVSKQLLSELWNSRLPLRLIGISLTDISYGDEVQLTLFPNRKKDKFRKLDQTLDHIRKQYGNKIVIRGSILNESIQVGKKYQAQLDEANEKTDI